MPWLDRLVAGLLAPLAMWVLASGLDDLFLDLCATYFGVSRWWRRRGRGLVRDGEGVIWPDHRPVERSIALFIPAWREDAVIEKMLDHNIAAISYSNYQIFLGVYPNDMRTLSRVRASEAKYTRVHHVLCPHDGPTSKADCLNWVYRGMLCYEEQNGCRFEIVLHHDAEDVIHPKSLAWISRYGQHYQMVQMPVLPLPTPWWELTHGTYCDDFAQSSLRDLQVRQRLGGFLPSCGVGTAYQRGALDRLAWNNGGDPFRAKSLTEDYEVGLELDRLGNSQVLLDAKALGNHTLAATREYFPRQWRGAVRQRARWVAGITLQSWQETGWNAGPGQLYWLWRDRKGLLNNPLTVAANLIFLYGLGQWCWARWTGNPWGLGQQLSASPLVSWVLVVNVGLILIRLGVRAGYVRSAYGWKHARSPSRS